MSFLLRDYLPTPFQGGFDNRRISPEFASDQKPDATIFPPIRSKDYGFPYRPPEPKPPFWPFLVVNGDGSYSVWFWEGYVIERGVKSSAGVNPISFHAPTNLYSGSGVNLFPISEGQAAYVRFEVFPSGQIKTMPEIVIDADDTAFVRYYPPIGDYAGQEGKFSYKLCSLIDGGEGDEKLKLFLAGDNVHHIIERFSMQNLQNIGGDCYNVLKTYLPSDDEVQFRSLEQLSGSGSAIISSPSSGENTVAFRRVKERDSSPQVRVSEDGDAIQVRGNGKDGSLVWYDCDGNSNVILTWEDGLITSDSNSFQAGCGTSTPTETPTELPP